MIDDYVDFHFFVEKFNYQEEVSVEIESRFFLNSIDRYTNVSYQIISNNSSFELIYDYDEFFCGYLPNLKISIKKNQIEFLRIFKFILGLIHEDKYKSNKKFLLQDDIFSDCLISPLK